MAHDYYAALIAAAPPTIDRHDAHVLACILTIGIEEMRTTGTPLTDAIGLQPAELLTLLDGWFPALSRILGPSPAKPVVRAADETCLFDLLHQAATTAVGVAYLAAMVARRAQRPDHLWQDLGLRARTELTALMRRHFHVLAIRNTRDMKWKKYLYRTICGDAGYTVCTAPSCSECADFDNCFGDESGESFLARARRAADIAG